jgi:hypothetical protein
LERRRKERNREDGGSSFGGEGSEEQGPDGQGDESGSESSGSSGGKKSAGTDDEDEEDEASASVDVDLDEDAALAEVEPLIEEYAGYANDTLALLYTPFFVALLWMFYEETVVAKLYGIKEQDFVYYFLFSVVIAPAQIVIDICFLNIVEWYHHLPIHDYLDYMAHRFRTRKARWKGDEATVNT